MANQSPKPNQPLQTPSSSNIQNGNNYDHHWLKRICYNKLRDEPKDTRNVILIVAALITAVTFQAGVNPPGGVWQDSRDGHTAGRSIYATHKLPFCTFLVFNTLALSSSIFVIISLTYNFPFFFELCVATLSMIVTYGSAVFAIAPKESLRFRYILITACWPIVARACIELFKWLDLGSKVIDFFRKVPKHFKSFGQWIKG